MIFGLLYFLYINNSTLIILKEIVKMTKLNNLEICLPYQSNFYLKKKL